MNERKLDTRNKIMMGGLVVKAGLSYLHEDHKEVLLGMLVDAYNKIHSTEGKHHFDYYQQLGEAAFKNT